MINKSQHESPLYEDLKQNVHAELQQTGEVEKVENLVERETFNYSHKKYRCGLAL